MLLINRISSKALPKDLDFIKAASTYRLIQLWKESGLLEAVLVRLAEGTQGPSQLNYQKLLGNLQKDSTPQTRKLFISKLKLDHREIKPGVRLISDEEWATIKPLMCENTKLSSPPRSALNSIFSILIGKVNGNHLPKSLDFVGKTASFKFFGLWKRDGTLEKVLTRLVEVTQGSVQLEYKKALRELPGSRLYWNTKENSRHKGEMPLSPLEG